MSVVCSLIKVGNFGLQGASVSSFIVVSTNE